MSGNGSEIIVTDGLDRLAAAIGIEAILTDIEREVEPEKAFPELPVQDARRLHRALTRAINVFGVPEVLDKAIDLTVFCRPAAR